MDVPDPADLRVVEIDRFGILDTPPEPVFDGYIRIAARTFAAPIVGIGFVDRSRLWFKASLGLGLTEYPLDGVVLGAQTIASLASRVIPDTMAEPAFRDHPLVTGPPRIRFYASVPLVASGGFSIGLLFIADTVPRPGATMAALKGLEDIAMVIMAGLEARAPHVIAKADLEESRLINQVLDAAVAAPGIDAALSLSMSVINSHFGGCTCLVWHYPPGAGALRQVTAIANPDLTARGFLAATRALSLLGTQAAPGAAVRTLEQVITRDIAAIPRPTFPVVELSQDFGIVSQITTPIRVESEIYTITLGFDRRNVDLDRAAAVLRKLVQALSPLLRHALTSDRAELFRRIVEASSDSVLVTEAGPLDEPGPRIVYANPAFRLMSGRSVADVIGHSPRLLQGRGTDAAARARIRAALAAGRPVAERLVNYLPDGTPYTVELQIAPVADARGWITHFVAIERDVTERLRMEEERRQEIALLSEAMRLARFGLWRINLRRQTLEWSDELYTMFGMDRADSPVTRAISAASVHPDDRERVTRWLDDLQYTSGRHRIEYRRVRPDGRVVYCWVEGKAAVDIATGDPVVEGFCQDITERRETEIALQHLEKLRTIGQMTGGVAHDFNNLLTVITVSLDLAATRAAGDAEMLALIHAAQDAAEKGAHLTAQLLAYSRRQRLTPRQIRPGSFAAGLAETIPRTLGPKYTVRTEVDAAAELFMADPNQLEAAVINLFFNARDAQPEGGELRLLIAPATSDAMPDSPDLRPGRYTAISVTDHGVGIDPATQAKVFEPFFTTKPIGKGTGLGLSMVLGFARQSGGHAAIKSAPGHGTTVTLFLPVATEPAETIDPATAPVPGRLPPIEVLLVEDKDDVREATMRLCADCGMVPTPTSNVEEALAYLRAGIRFGLLLTGINPGGDLTGAGFAAAAWALQPDLPVLFTSGSGHDPSAGVRILEKPYTRAELVAAVLQATA
jgi:PAS domain S-box-containing protein